MLKDKVDVPHPDKKYTQFGEHHQQSLSDY